MNREDRTEVVQAYQEALGGLTRGQFFGVDFVKRDGTTRRMSAKLINVNQMGPAAYKGNLIVLDATTTAQTGAHEIRSFNLDRVLRLKIAGKELC